LINRADLIHRPYKTINAALAGCILLIFIYSAIFSPEAGNYPIPSSHGIITGEKTVSSGLSRAFSSIVRLRFDNAKTYNIHSLRIFMFFLIQFFIRIMFLISHFIIQEIGETRFATLDATLSIVMFIFFFEPFLIDFLNCWK
jgi:hypothetical protein